jgi:hypothetical protein
MYANWQGRFTSVDPLLASGRTWSPQSWNRYSYTLNRPLSLIDPTGLEDEDLDPQSGRKNDQKKGQEADPNIVQKMGDTKTNVPRIISAKSRQLDNVGGEVPVGGRFQIEYTYEINNPAETDGNKDPGSYGSIEPIKDGGTLGDQTSPFKLSETKMKIKDNGNALEVTKTDTFVVTSNAHSAVNFQVVARDPLVTTKIDRLPSSASDYNNKNTYTYVDKNGKSQEVTRTRPKSIYVDSKPRR